MPLTPLTPLTDARVCEAVEALSHTLVALVRAAIVRGTPATQPPAVTAERNALARMLDTWPLLCLTTRDAVHGDDSYGAMLYYERVRLGIVNAQFFLDGLPVRVPVFGAPIALQFPAERMRELLYDDVVNERLHTIQKLELMEAGSAKLTQLATTLDALPDVSARVPLTVRLFLSRMRSMCAGLRGVKPASNFVQCQNNACCRLFYKGERVTTAENLAEGPVAGSSALSCASKYWDACAPMPRYVQFEHRFCTVACAEQWYVHYQRLMPDDQIAYDSELTTRAPREGAERVAFSFDQAIARNARAVRVFRKHKRKHKRGSALSRADVNCELAARLERLNVDTGLLYAAALMARLPCMIRGRRLPGWIPCWRKDGAEAHRNALIRVARMYRQHPAPTPIHDLLDMPAFLRAIRTKVTSIF